jgi:hypothetical protein
MTDAQAVRMVPVEPTREMWAAGGTAALQTAHQHHDKIVETVWSAMLAAAPSVQPDREVIARVQQMIVDCEADPDGPLMLAASVAKEHAADLRAILSALQPVAQKEEGKPAWEYDFKAEDAWEDTNNDR